VKALVISPHPDDEALGCAGTLLRHKDQGDEVYWLIMTKISKELGYEEEKVEKRSKEIQRVSDKLGVNELFTTDYLTTKLDTYSIGDITSRISDVVGEVNPQRVYLPNRYDIHTDHEVVFRAAISALKFFRHPEVEEILMYETISETEFGAFSPDRIFWANYFVDITDFMEDKIQVASIYESELGEHPFPRSEKHLRALATARGAEAGVEYAESFQLIKKIEKKSG